MNGLARICWITSPLYLLAGMVFGIWMSATGDHTLAPAHAHLNLIGGVMMALFGTFYMLRPNAAVGALGKIQVALAHVSVWAMFPGIIMAISGGSETLAKIGAILFVVSMLMFVAIVVRSTSPRSA
ncbi:hypothetical protein JJB09_19125 [Rhizobium sp. KVB221]|uniref:Uncharacterized protein n=1 Tax=Rhizobium setariae TaxID=2801340 RepID=A0A936YP78_9HYPH|nr:hypothetical protein [Rhizobium setariae]MBL0374140.1 hypothetical protein [Rhizobium setariae]